MEYIIEELPEEWANKTLFDVDLIGYLNKKLDIEEKWFCGFMPRPDGMIKEVVFLKR